MIRKSKIYARPKKPFEKERIKEENILRTKYGLKNKREIWKTLAKVKYFRSRAKSLANSPIEEQEVLFNKLKSIGLKTNTLAEVLDLKIEDVLKRRLSSVLTEKKIANTPKEARQMITHKRILINGKVIDSPSYLVKSSEENLISTKKKVNKPVNKTQETSQESKQNEEEKNE